MDLITELYYGNINPVEQIGKLTPEPKAILKWIHENEDKLESTLNGWERDLLHVIQDDHLDMASIMAERGFGKRSASGPD